MTTIVINNAVSKCTESFFPHGVFPVPKLSSDNDPFPLRSIVVIGCAVESDGAPVGEFVGETLGILDVIVGATVGWE